METPKVSLYFINVQFQSLTIAKPFDEKESKDEKYPAKEVKENLKVKDFSNEQDTSSYESKYRTNTLTSLSNKKKSSLFFLIKETFLESTDK